MPHLSALSLALNRPGAVSLEQVVASLFANNEQGAWYDPSAANVTWRRNLLTYTEQFDNAAWAKIGTAPTITANDAAAPDGTATADRILFNASSISNRLQQTLTGYDGPITLSIYLKGNVGGETIKISDGWTVSSTLTLTTAWVRYSATFAGNAGSAFYMLYADSGTPTVYAWGAQFERSSSATPYQRIVTPEITYLADVQSQPLLFTDSTGAAPVTGVEQPVGLILDKRKGLVLGPELVSNAGGPFTSTTGYSAAGGATLSVSGGYLVVTNGSYGTASTTLTIPSGKYYKLVVNIGAGTGSSARIVWQYGQAGSASYDYAPNVGTVTLYVRATVTNPVVGLSVLDPTAGRTMSFGSLSVMELDGNHAYQTGSTARPVLRARYNLLEYSEQFDNAYWTKSSATIAANSVVAPDGTTTADTITFSSSGGRIQRAINVSGQCVSIYVKPNVGTRFAIDTAGVVTGDTTIFELSGVGSVVSTGANNSNSTITALANGWYRISTARGSTAGGTIYIGALGAGGGSTDSFYIWGADLRVGTSAGDYQRIAAATDYATTSTITGQPFRPYLNFDAADGTGDGLQTAATDYGGINKMAVWVGTLLNSGSGQNLVMHGANDTFTNIFEVRSAGLTFNALFYDASGVNGGYNTASINTNQMYVLCSRFDLSQPSYALRINNRLDGVASNVATGGAYTPANFSSQPIHIGKRTLTASPLQLNGRIYGIIMRAAVTSDAEASAGEKYIASKMGLTL